MYCHSVKSHTTLHQSQFFTHVLLCSVKSHTTLHQGQFFPDVLSCSVKSHTTLHQSQFFTHVLLCSVKSHTTLHQGQFFPDVLSCSVKAHTTLHQSQFFTHVLLCSVKSHTTLHQSQFFSTVLSCNAKAHTTPSSRSSLTRAPPFIIVNSIKSHSRTTLHHSQFHQVKVIRNSEVLLPNFLWWPVAEKILHTFCNQDHSQWQELAQDLIRCTWTNPAAQVCCELLHVVAVPCLCVCVRGAKLAFCTLLQFSWCVYLRCYGILRYVAVYMGLGGQKTFALSCIHQRRHATCRMKGIDRG